MNVNKWLAYVAGALILLNAVTTLYLISSKRTGKIAYVDTGKLMVGFAESNKANQELDKEKKEFEANLKVLQDSVKACMDVMSKEYDRATKKKKLELRQRLNDYNQKMNKYQAAGQKKISDKEAELLQKVFSKVNLFLTEYGKQKRYNIILGTTQNGSILYGDEKGHDITSDVIEGLNERYK